MKGRINSKGVITIRAENALESKRLSKFMRENSSVVDNYAVIIDITLPD